MMIDVKNSLVAVAAMAFCTAFSVEPFPEIGAPRRLTDGPHDHLLASYFGISSWSPDLRYLTVLETDLNKRLPEVADAATIGLVDTADGNRFIPVAKTVCWNFQEAAMAHWLDNDTFLYNDLRNGRFVTVIRNWRTGSERIVPHPVSAVAPDGRKALSLNYARLRLTRPDYGYPGEGQDAREGEPWPEDDGLWLVDLKTGEAKLIVSVASCRGMMPAIRKPGGLAYFCHTVFSRDGSKIFWLARTVDFYDKERQIGDKGRQTTSFTCNADGSGVRRCFPDGWGGSHFGWKDGDTICVTAKRGGNPKDNVHVEFTVGDEGRRRCLGGGLLDWDGHCTYSPDGRWLSTDGYWDVNFERKWALLRLEDGAILPLGKFFVDEKYRGNPYWRCDLHARWRPDGRQLGFNSVHEGSRQVYVIDLNCR